MDPLLDYCYQLSFIFHFFYRDYFYRLRLGTCFQFSISFDPIGFLSSRDKFLLVLTCTVALFWFIFFPSLNKKGFEGLVGPREPLPQLGRLRLAVQALHVRRRAAGTSAIGADRRRRRRGRRLRPRQRFSMRFFLCGHSLFPRVDDDDDDDDDDIVAANDSTNTTNPTTNRAKAKFLHFLISSHRSRWSCVVNTRSGISHKMILKRFQRMTSRATNRIRMSRSPVLRQETNPTIKTQK